MIVSQDEIASVTVTTAKGVKYTIFAPSVETAFCGLDSCGVGLYSPTGEVQYILTDGQIELVRLSGEGK